LEAVPRATYLLFIEGYLHPAGDSVTRHDWSREAIRFGELIVELLPTGETLGLLALMLLHESRREARATTDGDLILLADQDRSLWRWDLIERGIGLVESALRSGPIGSFALQAAIAAVHAEAPSTEETDWAQIVGLYDALL